MGFISAPESAANNRGDHANYSGDQQTRWHGDAPALSAIVLVVRGLTPCRRFCTGPHLLRFLGARAPTRVKILRSSSRSSANTAAAAVRKRRPESRSTASAASAG